jgi:L-lysine 2,3-aminomutase
MSTRPPILAPTSESVGPPARREDRAWQVAMRTAVRDVDELCSLLELPRAYARRARAAAGDFPLFVPRGYLARMRKGDPADPLLRQVLPVAEEVRQMPGYVPDPVDEAAAELVPGLLRKYHGRALLVTTGVCAVHCRYCFRRHFPYGEGPKSLADWESALASIRADETIREVILSGGDPLTLSDHRLLALTERIAGIEHVTRLRVHTRLPVVIPERVTPDLVAWLRGSRLTSIVVIHANHANEVDDTVAQAAGRLVDAGVPVLNQAVLLAGVNDSPEAQIALWERLSDVRVLAYYLHRLDRVAGATHFDVPIDRGRAIAKTLRDRLSGYAVPQFVEEIPGAASKVPL